MISQINSIAPDTKKITPKTVLKMPTVDIGRVIIVLGSSIHRKNRISPEKMQISMQMVSRLVNKSNISSLLVL